MRDVKYGAHVVVFMLRGNRNIASFDGTGGNDPTGASIFEAVVLDKVSTHRRCRLGGGGRGSGRRRLSLASWHDGSMSSNERGGRERSDDKSSETHIRIRPAKLVWRELYKRVRQQRPLLVRFFKPRSGDREFFTLFMKVTPPSLDWTLLENADASDSLNQAKPPLQALEERKVTLTAGAKLRNLVHRSQLARQ